MKVEDKMLFDLKKYQQRFDKMCNNFKGNCYLCKLRNMHCNTLYNNPTIYSRIIIEEWFEINKKTYRQDFLEKFPYCSRDIFERFNPYIFYHDEKINSVTSIKEKWNLIME